MTKFVHYLLIARALPKDSEVLFFETIEEAYDMFRKLTQPLLSINGLQDGIDYYEEDDWCIRFNAGENEELSANLDYQDQYFHVGTQDVDIECTHYIAEFSEYTDESNINFFTKERAITAYNDLVDDGIQIQHTRRNQEPINRYDQTTWEDEKIGTLFSETDNNDGSTDAFFGYDDMYWIYRIGAAKFAS